MNKVKVVTGYVPLPVKHLSQAEYKKLGNGLKECVPNIRVFDDFPLEDCWLTKWLDQRVEPVFPAAPVPADRYETPEHNVWSNIVQHQRTTWAMQAAIEDLDVDTFVWIDYGILKQGDFTGKRVTQQHIAEFIQRLETTELDDIPFPGIWSYDHGKLPISDTDVNWRFCGSVHIWPRKFLGSIDCAYGQSVMRFIERTGTVPNDLPIWAAVERDYTVLPFRWYQANHDATQFTNFRNVTPLCLLAEKYRSDKGGHHEYTPIYYDMFKDRRHDIHRVLEVGIGYPGGSYYQVGASLRMWSDFFPDAQIYGFDNNPASMINEGRIRSVLADQNSEQSLKTAAKFDASAYQTGGEFDLIIDDGSHITEHQIITMRALLPFLAKDGVYIIEDLQFDCRPGIVGSFVPEGFRYDVVPAPSVITRCGCGCNGIENLLMIQHA